MRLTDIARHDRLSSRHLQDLADQRRGRRLAVRSRYRDHLPLQMPERQFHFGDHRDGIRHRLLQKRDRQWNTRAEDDGADAGEKLLVL